MTRIACAFALLLACPAFAATFDVSQPPKDGEKYKSADFRLWVPDGVTTVRAVIVRQHGCGRKGIDHADDLQWQALAAKYDVALLGTHFQQAKECKDWFDPAGGSERAFFDALAHFAKESKHPELVAAPWAIWGHSGGSLWACHMTNRHPERVVAVWGRSQALTDYGEKALGVPVVFNYGTGEKAGQFASVHKNSQEAFAKYRPKGALWAVAIDPKSSHDCRNSRALAVLFFDKMLTARLPKDGVKLKSLADGPFWRGESDTLAVLSPEVSRGNPLADSWLIDEPFAKAWQEYCKTGDVTDATPPPVPTGATATAGDKGVSLTWAAVADIESGLKQFVIRKNGAKVGTAGGEKVKGNPNGFVQVWNYGDEPEPKATAFAFADPDGKAGDQYTLTAVNHAGLESKPSAPATAK